MYADRQSAFGGESLSVQIPKSIQNPSQLEVLGKHTPPLEQTVCSIQYTRVYTRAHTRALFS